jgi:predicted signal transduction protein with EAL and GGDEF domain
VETRRQHESITRIGCDFAQGYYYAAPMPVGAISTVLGSRGTSATNLLPPPRLTLEADKSQVGQGGLAD